MPTRNSPVLMALPMLGERHLMFPQPMTLLAGVWRSTLFCLLLSALTLSARAELRVTEVMAEDYDVLADEDGDHSGWVELFNSGPESVPLLGYGLSDDTTRPFRWTFPAVTLDAGARLVVFTSGKDRLVPAGPTNAAVELAPNQISGLQWWIDAADSSTLTVNAGRVAEWRDKTGRQPAAEYPAPQAPNGLSGKVLWLDAADAASLELAGSAVSRWRDRSGSSNNAAQATAGQRPVRITDTNGLPHLRFDGQDDVLNFSSDVSVQTLAWVGIESPQVQPTDFRPFVGHPTKFDFLRGASGTLLGQSSRMAPGIRNATVYLNGTRVDPATTVLPPGLNVVIIVGTGPGVFGNLADDRGFAGGKWWGEVAELIGFNRGLAASEALGLDRHLRAKWKGQPDPQLPVDFAARQSRPEWQPRLVHDPLTGLPAVQLDGVDDRMPFAEIKQARSIFLVVREGEYASDSYRPFLGHNSSAALTRGTDRLLLYSGSPQTWMEGEPVNPVATRPPSRRVLLSFHFPTSVPFDNLGMDRIYDELLYEGDVHEIALFDRVLTDTERTALEAQLSRKWNLPDRRLHANFSLKAAGEPVLLSAPDGRLVDTAPALTSSPNQSVGRLGDGADWGWFATPTPGQSNGAVGVQFGVTAAPTSHPAAGFYSGTNQVRLLPATNSPAGTRIYYTLDGSDPATGLTNLWLEDALPEGAVAFPSGSSGWNWGKTNPVPVSGARSLQSGTAAGRHQYVITLAEPLVTGTNGLIHLELWCDPVSPPRTVMLQAYVGTSWEHRAFWGEDLIALGKVGTPAHVRVGDLPTPGLWRRLTVPVASLGLTNSSISGLALTLFDGRAAVDSVGYTAFPLPRIYEGPLTLTNSTVVRARAVAPGQLASAALTASFVQGQPGGLPVVSLSAAPADLFDETTGLYAEGPKLNADGQARVANYQRNWERPVHAELFEPDGSPGFSVDCGLKIHGAFSRHWPQRSMRLHFRQRYGVNALRYPVFPGHPVERFDSLVLRNGGNDWNSAYLRDDLAHSLAADIGLGHQASRPAHVFLNGAYWGVMPIREHANDDTISRQHGIDGDLDVIKNEIEVVSGDKLDHTSLCHAAQVAISDPTQHPLLAARVNAANYWDWLGLETFANNVDWPGNNVMTWRQRGVGQLWNWMLVDCDGGFYGPWVSSNILKDVLSERGMGGNAALTMGVMRGLLNNDEYRRQFALRLSDLLNTTLSAAHTMPRLDQLEAGLAGAMPAQIARWKDSFNAYKPPGSALQSMAAWRTEVQQAREFLRDRPAIFRGFVRDYFGLGNDVNVTVTAQPASGVRRLRVATLEFGSAQLPWTGTYFAGLPVEITVEPAPGFKLTGWSDGVPAGASRVVTPTEALSLTALLEPDDTLPAFPARFALAGGDYVFNGWPAGSAAGTYPPSLAFETSAVADPGLGAELNGYWTNRYDLPSRSRVIGAGDDGVAFVNTSNPQTQNDFVTGALLALDTTGVSNVEVGWTAGTMVANSRVYGLRLQWRVGATGAFADVLTPGGAPMEYVRNPTDGHTAVLAPVPLPAQAGGQPLVQLRWRYYSIPQPNDSGPRAQLRLDDIRVTAARVEPSVEVAVTMQGGTLVVAATATPGATCVLWASTDLLTWNEIASGPADANGHRNFTANPEIPFNFYQVRLR